MPNALYTQCQMMKVWWRWRWWTNKQITNGWKKMSFLITSRFSCFNHVNFRIIILILIIIIIIMIEICILIMIVFLLHTAFFFFKKQTVLYYLYFMLVKLRSFVVLFLCLKHSWRLMKCSIITNVSNSAFFLKKRTE